MKKNVEGGREGDTEREETYRDRGHGRTTLGGGRRD